MRRTAVGRACLLAVCWLGALPAVAGADWLFTPFLGTAFQGRTVFLDLDLNAVESRHWIVGGAAGWLGDGIVGVEGEVAHIPGFFDDDQSPVRLVTSSRVRTYAGSVLVTLPVSVTRESLRPYLAAGLSHLDVRRQERVVGLTEVRDSVGLQVGGGAIAFVNDRAGLRIDLRHVRSMRRATDELRGGRRTQLSFWRATFGVTLRY